VSAHVPSGGATAAAEAASASTCGGLVDQQEKEKQEEQNPTLVPKSSPRQKLDRAGLDTNKSE
jgi:hypothetical protein